MAAQAINVELSGQVNKAYEITDNSEVSDRAIVDNDVSSTRFRFKGSEDIGDGVKAGIYWEVQHQSNPSNRLDTQPTPADIGDGPTDTPQVGFSERHAEVFFESGFGKLSLGQGDGVGNGGTERDLSGTTVVALASRVFMGGGVTYDCGGPRPTSTSGSCGFTVGQSYNSLDGFSRYDRVRYDTPTLGPGIVLSVDSGNRNVWEYGASIRTSLGGGKLDGAIFYSAGDQRNNISIVGGSVSYLFGTGTSLTGHYADGDINNSLPGQKNPNAWGIKLGQKWGMNAFAIDYSLAGDQFVAGVTPKSDDTSSWGVSWVYSLPGPKVDIYAGYRLWDSDLRGVNNRTASDVDVVMIGSRIKF
jgi:predicted porin